MKRNRNWMVMVCLLAFVVLSISSCGKAVVATVGSATKTSVATSGSGAQNVASNKRGQKTPSWQAASGISGTPIVYKHELVLTDNSTVYVGSSKGTLTALDASRGTVKWQKSLGFPIYSASIAGTTIITANEQTMYAFDASSGNQIWSKQVARLAASGVSSAGGIVYVESAIANDSFYTVTALRVTNGSQLWQYRASGDTPDFLGAASGTAYVVEMHGSDLQRIDQSLTALRVDDGKVLWHVALNDAGGLVRAKLVAANGTVYLTTVYGSVIALRSSTGALVWQHIAQKGTPPAGVGDALPVALANGVVYANDTQETIALRANDGYVLWKKGYAYAPSLPFIVQPVVEDGVVYSGIRGEFVQALRAQDGTELWQSKAVTVDEPLVVQAGLLYVNASSKLYTLHVRDGSVVWQQAIQYPDGLGREVHEAITSEDVSIGQTNGMVQTFNALNGDLLWSRTV